ncbi:MAG TPA: protein kinase [Solirubrobacteraceae bacterium]|jgi:serine/threonine-protein kinase|nr:protein kinase [Solirubrobacteraceae bacterium]
MTTVPQTLVGGRYRLERQIGAGATARVWVALDEVLERRVAIKMLATPIGGDADHIERFRREARAVAKLQHPHIVTVLDSGEHEDMPFIVLEYVEGETLKARIQRVGRLTVTEALAFAIEIARGLEAAHARGIIHRDVKPQNILLDSEGGAKITDFGIARSGGEDALTVGGHVLGTTDYVSPEQALGHLVTGQSDVYSLGVVLYESLTGAVPFSGSTHIAVATMHVREEMPDLQQRRPGVSAALAACVERATAKHLARRYASASEMIADLEEAMAIETARTGDAGREATAVLRSLPPKAAQRVPLRVRHPVWLTLAAVAAIGAIAAIAAFVVSSTHHGVGAPAGLGSSGREVDVPLNQDAAVQYNPFGTSAENASTVGYAIDGDKSTSWATASYVGGVLGKSGVGLYVDATPGVRANEAVVATPTRGFHFQIWGTNRVPAINYTPVARNDISPSTLGWTLLGSAQAGRTTIVHLSHIKKRIYYLLWITDLGPDPTAASKDVEIAEFHLRRASR